MSSFLWVNRTYAQIPLDTIWVDVGSVVEPFLTYWCSDSISGCSGVVTITTIINLHF
ncbi:MAG: hypothetical protein IPP08_10185 [Chlorobiota bacterium]|nr:hypothetical protein [Chlorobiota bacterium]QQS66124.1 MAG: hypothetical protein IPP08_10185 [Chlorobiota bacterium]